MKTFRIEGRRWFQKSYGNTYFSVDIYLHDVLLHSIPFQYGYDRQYYFVAIKWLEENGYIKKADKNNETYTIDESVTDVKRKKDL